MHSQYGEDAIVIECLDRYDIPEHKRRLLDIGAWDPVTFSNSRALIEQGWGGVLIEPSPGPLKNLLRQYANTQAIRVVGAAVTVHGGLLELAITDDAVSMPTDDLKRLADWSSNGGYFGRLTVPSISVVDLFTGLLGGDYEFVSIDTEGTSCDIFAEMCRIGPRPRCVIVEHDSRFVELSQHAEAAHYRLLHENGTNRVYEWTGRRE